MIDYTGEDGMMYAYPPGYGAASCAAHDMLLPPTCATDGVANVDAPLYCADQWCFVNKNTCP